MGHPKRRRTLSVAQLRDALSWHTGEALTNVASVELIEGDVLLHCVSDDCTFLRMKDGEARKVTE